MRRYRWFLIGLSLIGLVIAEAAAAQQQPAGSPPQAQTQHQRAPGVPLSPNAGETQKPAAQGERTRTMQERDRLARNRSGPPEPLRQVPMPKPVPSIIAP